MEETPFHIVTTVEGVETMVNDCKRYKEIAVDLEVNMNSFPKKYFH